MHHIMVDLETLGTVASASIISIGAVKFDLESDAVDDAGFYASVSLESNLDLGRRIQEDTLKWWLKQDTEAQAVFHEDKVPLELALDELTAWIGPKEYQMWSNGADFDLPMLAHAYNQIGAAVPWKFWNSNCFRTYKKLPGARAVRTVDAGVKHNALGDAYSQAKTLQAIHASLFKPKGK